MAEVIYRIEGTAPRARYILRHVLERMLGWHAEEAPDLESFRSSSLPKIHYGGPGSDGAISIKPSASILLSRPAAIGSSPILQTDPQEDHDIFAAAFYLLSRMEEYGAIDRDEHGRPITHELSVHRTGVIREPVVDQWVLRMADGWRRRTNELPPVRRHYSQVITLDVDNGFMYLGRPLWRTVGSASRDLLRGHLSRIGDRMRVLSGSQADPYDIYEDLKTMTAGRAGRRIVNFLVAPRGRRDHAVGLTDRKMVQRMREVSQWAEVGVHPGYESMEHPDQISRQRDALSSVIGRPVVLSRQHFLRMRWPDTLRELCRIGMREEHSMGLSDDIGFRAGTCTPFPFYDLEKEEGTQLMIHPFAVMDSAMAYAQRKSPDEAIAAMRSVVDRVKTVKGCFIGVWHERFISDYGNERGWRRVVQEVIEHARP